MKPLFLSSVFCLSLLISGSLQGQDDLTKTILHHDSIFWNAYNNCDVATMEKYFTDDLEFYHDKGGLTVTADSLFKSVRNGLCGPKNDWRLRREAIGETIKVYPLNNYGAILSGEHYFYVKKNGQAEYLDGLARFTHVWKFADNQWKMHRVLSYDHGPASRRKK